MTFSKFIGLGVVLWLLLSVLKAIFLRVFSLDTAVMQVLYCLLVLVIAIACVRRVGVINYLEAMMIAAVWTIFLLLADFIVLQLVLGSEIFRHGILWLGYFIAAMGIFLFHKKRHVHIRRQQAAHHHGHKH